MKLYNAPMPAPNPRRVRMFLAEKGRDAAASVELIDISILEGAHKHEAHIARNSLGQLPTLELDDGRMLSETVAICRYLESVWPDPPLFGRDAFEVAEIDMWVRRVEFQVMSPVGMFWRHAHPFTARVVTPQYKEFGQSNRLHYERALNWLDKEVAERPFIAGEGYTIADICALTTIDFADWIGLKFPDNLPNLGRWRADVSARPSASA
ncbi:MAG: glutathione S-transferase [Hyphomonadaceae bacterium]